ncbi:MAG: putative DNA-binding domain-containing protein [Planctomycetes bacterium]|nr:putative DNA-binding domain-containing protein [Planctomycetota bacterium]
MTQPSALRRLQRWFAAIVEHPSTAAVAIASRPANALVKSRDVAAGRVIRPNPRLSPAAMLDVYNGGYLARLLEVMEGDYGASRAVLGEDGFRALVARFLRRHPSRHPNLNRFGRPFPAFVRGQRALRHRAFLAELAALELALCTAFDAEEFTPLAPDATAGVPEDRWSRLRFVPNPSLQLLAFRFPVDEVYQAHKEGKRITVPKPRPTWLAVFRRDDRVWRQRLTRPAHRVLASLAGGRPLGEALAGAGPDQPVADWFRGFSQDGLFTAFDARGRSARRD